MSIAHPGPASTPSGITERKAIYQQALDDFAIADLLAKLQDSQHMTEAESELIAALLVQQLAKNLGSQLVTAYFKAIRQGNQEVVPEPIGLEYPESIDLPVGFPADTRSPCFTYGDRLRLCSVPINDETETETDTGRCIGSYYAYAPHQCQWIWKYVIWLDKDSVSASWCVATTAWEDDLEPVIQEESLS
jgi:hypothetical protein